MKDLAKLTLPYPVLGLGIFDISETRNFVPFKASIAKKDDKYEISISLNFDNEYILSLISDGKADYVCEVEGKKTHFRKSYSFDGGREKVIEIAQRDLHGVISLTISVVATSDIYDYCNPVVAKRYRQLYDVKRGDFLAYLGHEERPVDVSDRELNYNSSFMAVCKSPTEEYSIALGDNKIKVYLPYERYKAFALMQEIDLPLVYSTVVMNALIYALCNIDNPDYANCNWAWILKEKWLKSNLKVTEYEPGCIEPFPFANSILQNPYNDVFVIKDDKPSDD